jgi:hypothetical protein
MVCMHVWMLVVHGYAWCMGMVVKEAYNRDGEVEKNNLSTWPSLSAGKLLAATTADMASSGVTSLITSHTHKTKVHNPVLHQERGHNHVR